MQSTKNENSPKSTWRLASYLPPDNRRKGATDRRDKPRDTPTRRQRSRRSLLSLLKL